MDEFVKKQLEQLGYNETDNGDIFLALQDINEMDFRGLTVQKVRQLIPNQPSVQMNILVRIEVLRANAVLIAHENSGFSSNVASTRSGVGVGSSSSTSSDAAVQKEGSQSQIQSEIKPEPIDYSSGSDVEIMPSPRRPKKRANVVDLGDQNSKVMRTGEENSERNEPGPKQFGQSELEVSTNESVPPRKKSSSISTLTPTSKSNLRRQEPKKRQVAPRTPTSTRYTLVDANFIETSKWMLSIRGYLQRDTNYKVDSSLENNAKDLSIFYKNLGQHVQRLELGFWTWIRTPQHSNISKPEEWWHTDLGKILYYFCPKLRALTLLTENSSNNGAINDDISTQSFTSGEILKLPNLKELNLTNCSNVVLKQVEHIFRAANHLERFQLAFEKVDQVEKILNLIQKLSGENCLQRLREIRILGLSENASVNSEHFLILSMSNLVKLDSLEIVCGLRDVSKESFESVLNKFSSSLVLFHCYGTFFGQDWKYFSLVVPKMKKLIYFSIGADYEFDFTEKNLSTVEVRTEDGKEQLTRVHDIEERDFINFGLQMSHMYKNVETIKIGNMCTLEDLHFSSFPKLKTFEVGGPWDRMIKFPSRISRHSSYPNIEVIQIPDGLKNMSLILEISHLFPNLSKVRMWLPSAQCLERFLRLMVKSKLRELRLKTNFCFSWTLEEIFIGKVNSGKRSLEELCKLKKLKMYKYCNEYVAFHNIDLPPEDEDIDQNSHSDIIKFLNQQLEFVEVEHIGRILRVPLGEHHFQDSRCEYHPERIGFLKKYPLSTKHYLDGFNTEYYDGTLFAGQYRTKNIRVKSARSENMHLQPEKPGTGTVTVTSEPEQKLKVRPTPALLIKPEGVKAEQQ